MKRMKKLLAIVLVGAMTLAMGSVAFGAMQGDTPASGDTGSIVVNGLDSGVTVSAYQIAYATYDETTGNFIGYAMVDGTDGCTFQIQSDGSYTGALTEANLTELYEVVSANDATKTATVSIGADFATLDGLVPGSYLIVVSGSNGNEATAYSMMIGSVSYTTDVNGDWTITDGALDTSSDGNYWVKATTPQETKSEDHNGTATVGDTINYTIEITNIPKYEGAYPKFIVTDTLTGLSMDESQIAGITVKVGGSTLTAGTDYVVTQTDDGFTVNFVVWNGSSWVYTLNDYAGQTLTITYSATVTEPTDDSAVSDHSNSAKTEYATDSNDGDPDSGTGPDNPPDPGDGNTGTTGGEDEPGGNTDDYSFSVKLHKTDADNEALAGATFTVSDSDGEVVGTATSIADGTFTFSGLAAGTYTLVETEAPAGYVLPTAEYKIVVTANANQDGSLGTWSVVIQNSSGQSLGTASGSGTSGTNDTGVYITNTQVSGELPSTGGRGTLIFTLIGCAIVVCAVAGVVATRKRRAA